MFNLILLDSIWAVLRAPGFSIGVLLGATLAFFMTLIRKQIEASALALLSKIPAVMFRRFAFKLWERRYRRLVANQHKYIRLAGMRQQFEVSPPRLEDVFIDLELQQPAGQFSDNDLQASFTLRDTFQINGALAKFQHFVVLGEPGSGKTTLLQHLVALAAHPKRKGPLSRLLPIYIPLRSCSLNGRSLVEEIIDHRTAILPADLIARYPKSFFEARLEGGNCLLLFDGMDEVLDESRHVAAARMIDTAVVLYPRTKIVVTSRIAGWRNLLGSGFPRFVIRRLSLIEIERLVEQWYLAVILDRARSQLNTLTDEVSARSRQQALSLSRHVLGFLSENDRLMEIATTPLILSLMCLVYYVRHDLPERRILLYEECCRVLLQDWDKVDKQLSASLSLTYAQKNALLVKLAGFLFQHSAAEITRENLLRLLGDFLHDEGQEFEAESVLQHIEERSGILSEKAIGRYGFSHLTFQEYFSTVGLLAAPDGLKRLLFKVRNKEGDQVVLLFAGGAESADGLVEALRRSYLNSSDFRFLLLAGMAAAEAKSISLEPKSQLIVDLNQEFDAAKDDERLGELQKVLHALGVERKIVRRFREFEIMEELGRGGFATTYWAMESATARNLALKVYNSGTAKCAEQMADEVAKLRQLSHPALVQFFHAGTNRDQLFVTMELVDGLTLNSLQNHLIADFYTKRGEPWTSIRLSPTQETLLARWGVPELGSRSYFELVLSLTRDVVSGLNVLHGNGLLHGDLKPSNVLLFWNGNRVAAKLTDYSVDAIVAAAMHSDSLTALTRTGQFPPTSVMFSDPEFLFGTKIRANRRADVYSLGLLIGRCLLSIDIKSDLWPWKFETPPNLAGVSDIFDKLMSNGVMSVLQKSIAREGRFRSVEEFWLALNSTFPAGLMRE